MRETRVSTERCFSQEDFERFARLSGDDNPIHTDPEFSAGTRFGRTVAHGLLLFSVLRGLIDRLAPGGRVLQQSLMFPAPTYAGEPMRFSVSITGTHGGEIPVAHDISMEVLRIDDGVVTCQGRARVSL
jgi:acyl dehydratase